MSLQRLSTFLSVLLGMVFLVLTLPLFAADIETKFEPAGVLRYKTYPVGSEYKSYYLDNCYTWATDCGTSKAPNAWCQQYMGFKGGAVTYGGLTTLPVGEKSYNIGGDGSKVCDHTSCGVYSSITCGTTNPTTFVNPKYRGFRLDTTEKKSNGLKDFDVAKLYCQSLGFSTAFNSTSLGDASEPTKRIGDDSICSTNCGGFAYITCGNFNITAPSEKKQLETGKTVTINWISDQAGYVKIELYKGGSNNAYRIIDNETKDNGSFAWLIPADLPEGSDYEIRVSETSRQFLSSKVNVRIAPSAPNDFINISQPLSDTNFRRGKDEVQIAWTNSASIKQVAIDLINVGGAVISSIASRTLADGTYSWDVPINIPTGRYKIRIRDYANNSTKGESQLFNIVKFKIKVIPSNQNGSVTDSKGLIDCPGRSCEAEYDYNEAVRLTATPKQGYSFQHFSGFGSAGAANPFEFNVVRDADIGVSFSDAPPKMLNVQVTKDGSATGNVFSDPAGITDCGRDIGTCQASFSSSAVKLTAIPDSDYLAEFTAGCTSTTTAPDTCTVSMNGDRVVGVKFKTKPGSTGNVKLEFDRFPERLKYQVGQKMPLRLQVTKSPETVIKRVDVDWKGNGQGWTCKTDFNVNTVVSCDTPTGFTLADVGNQILTAKAYTSNGESNMLSLRYEVINSANTPKFTGHQNQEHLKKFWTVNPNSNKEAFAVDTATGTQALQLDFLHQHGLVDLDFSMKYNSGLAKGSSVGKLGRGWNHNYGILAKLEFINSYIVLNWSEGRKNLFIPSTYKNANCGVSSASEYCEEHGRLEGRLANYFDRISKVNGKYVLKRKDNTQYHFNNVGTLEKIINHKGQSFTLTHENGRLKQILQPDSNVSLNYSYYNSGAIKEITDASVFDVNTPDRKVQFFYSGNDLDYITDPVGNRHDFSYNANGEMETYTVSSGEESNQFFKNTYDSLGRIVVQEDGNNHTTTFTYDESEYGLITTKTTQPGINGQIITDKYNTNFQLLEHFAVPKAQSGADPDVRTRYAYTEQGMLRRTYVEPKGKASIQTDYEYDAVSGKETKVTLFDYPSIGTNTSTQKSYYDNGNLKSEKDELNVTVNYEYHPNNMLKSVTHVQDGKNLLTEYRLSDPNSANSVTETIISPRGRQTGKQTQQKYEKGRLIEVIDPEGNRVSYTYDAVGNKKQEVHYDKNSVEVSRVSYDYDNLGRVVSTTDAEGKVIYTQWSIHGEERILTDANSRQTVFEYDGNGNVKSKKDTLNNVTQFEYDENDHLIMDNTSDSLGMIENRLEASSVGRCRQPR